MTPATITPPPAGAAPNGAAVGPKPHRWTIREYREVGKTGLFHDRKTMLIGGEIYVMTMLSPPHDVALGLTQDYLRTAFSTGHHVRNQMGLDIGTENDPGPDLAVVLGSIRDYATRTPTAAVMVVEVADTSLFLDTTTKAELYATAGVSDYWVIDLENRRLLVFRDPAPLPAGLGATAYRVRLTLAPDGTIAPLAAPAAAVKVADLMP
ncbi:MAG: Uma2 family endonuclease [Gemmataceae bacterium]|nr:Uma2 family endonuclease [Gemmataceae bacterium]